MPHNEWTRQCRECGAVVAIVGYGPHHLPDVQPAVIAERYDERIQIYRFVGWLCVKCASAKAGEPVTVAGHPAGTVSVVINDFSSHVLPANPHRIPDAKATPGA